MRSSAPVDARRFRTYKKNNVHWFQALSEPAYIFNIHVNNINPEAKKRPAHLSRSEWRKAMDGRIKARLIDYGEVNKLYG